MTYSQYNPFKVDDHVVLGVVNVQQDLIIPFIRYWL